MTDEDLKLIREIILHGGESILPEISIGPDMKGLSTLAG